jgi:uncharacterized protein
LKTLTVHRILKASLLIGLTVYAVILVMLYVQQESLLFRPTITPNSQPLLALTNQGAGVQEFAVNVPGAKLSGLHLKLPSPKGVVFFLHGNGGNLDSWFINTETYRQNNMDLVMVDYRGYGKSTGQIQSEAQLHADVRAAWDHIAPQYVGKKHLIYGRSLGTGLAAKLSADLASSVDMTVLVSAYSSMTVLTSEIYPFVPTALLRYPLRTDQIVQSIKSPLMLIHGEQDSFIPPSHSQTLKALSPQAKLLIVNGAMHNDVHTFEAYLQGFGEILAKL